MTTVMLGDLPDARDFIKDLINHAEDIAIAETGKPDAEVIGRLSQYRLSLERQIADYLAPRIGAKGAAKGAAEMAHLFCRCVLGEKHERETLVAMGLL